ncbi:MAG TPA: DUF5804 family protein [Methanoregulaceae archaeon]|nr:MAG: hypothetical protein IPI71_01285 [Methanolinea sp.]HON80838.1 DUF5804 family protein [Methanoregulaceae archaeon]HPD09573.1 DUF5804 family protein [Methanoregulaceae archaeon]HRT15244.1 DUF5804 family protein [Methanoregulaceae archaeon]HRU30815.1 DUF5804 family protein [Methanoregulaceae archaeon]
MNVLFLPREGVSLYRELLASETSREALRFYRPRETHRGVEITVATLSSALALAADLRWYLKRYMRGVLFEIAPDIYSSHRLAREVYYDREISLSDHWDFRLIYRMQDGFVVHEEQILPGSERRCSGPAEIEVWCTEDEYHGGSDSIAEKGDAGQQDEEE